MAYGRCKLTGTEGKLVKSHLLPKAVTRTPVGGVPRVDGFNRERPSQRFDSWYDPEIVTRTGEDILADYDDKAITELRRLKLIWSGWGDSTEIPVEGIQWDESRSIGFREVTVSDIGRLRLFFLSLLWRAGVTSLPNYRISLPEDHIELLRKMLFTHDPSPPDVFPIVLTQLTTRGPWHNAGPRREYLPAVENGEPVPFIRFYFEGLIIHIYDDVTGSFSPHLGDMAIGENPTISIIARPFEGSAQEDWLQSMTKFIFDEHFDTLSRVFGWK